MSAFQSIARQIGLPPLDFSIDERSRGKIMRVSILPFLVFSAILTRVALEAVFGRVVLSAAVSIDTGTPEVWYRLYRIAVGIQTVDWIALAALLLFGLFRWSRPEGTWMLVIGCGLSLIAALAAVYFVVGYTIVTRGESLDNFKVLSIGQSAPGFALLATGYFFLAYRGLTSEPPRRRLRRVRRRVPPPGPAPAEG